MNQVKISATNRPQKWRLQDCSLDQNSLSRDFKFEFCIIFFLTVIAKKEFLAFMWNPTLDIWAPNWELSSKRKTSMTHAIPGRLGYSIWRRPFPISTCEVLLLPLTLVTEVATSKLEQWEQMFSFAVSGWETTKHIWGALTDCVGISPGLTGDKALLCYVCVEIGRTVVVFPPFPPNVCGSGVA